MGMRKWKWTYSEIKVADKKGIGIAKPLFLFFFGAMVPAITDELLPIVLCFVPFYGYMLWNEKKYDETTIFLSRLIFAISVLLAPLFSFVGYQGIIPALEMSGIVLAINVVPSFIFIVCVIFSVESRDPSKWSSYSPPSD